MNNSVETRKIVVYGDMGVGKTQIIHSLLQKPFDPKSLPTQVFDLSLLPLNDHLSFQIIDLSGDEKYEKNFSKHCYRSSAVILVYSVVDESSFDSLADRLLKLRLLAQNSEQFILVANKIDILDRKISYLQGKNFATMANLKYLELSAKTGKGIDILKYYLQNHTQSIKPYKKESGKLDLQQTVILLRLSAPNCQNTRKICNRLRLGINSPKSADYFNKKIEKINKRVKRLQYTCKSLLNTFLNGIITLLLVSSIIGLVIAILRGWLEANRRNTGHSFMFFKFGEKQQAQTVCNNIFLKTHTPCLI